MTSDDRYCGGWDDRAFFSIPTGQWPWEINQVSEIVKKKHPKKILEIGCLYGGTLAIWLSCLDGEGTVVGIDPNIDDVREYLNDPKLVLIKSMSREHRAIAKSMEFQPFDVLFIDGDHSYEGAKQDFMVYGEMVKKGGLIILHDIVTFRHEVGVPRLWEEIKRKHKTFEIVGKHTDDIPGGGIGIVYK